MLIDTLIDTLIDANLHNLVQKINEKMKYIFVIITGLIFQTYFTAVNMMIY